MVEASEVRLMVVMHEVRIIGGCERMIGEE